MPEALPIEVIQARLEQLGTIEDEPTLTDPNFRYYKLNFHVNNFPFLFVRYSTKSEAIQFLWKQLCTGDVRCADGIAFWWDEKRQDWGTSPNALEGWPAPTHNKLDIEYRRNVLNELRDQHDKTFDINREFLQCISNLGQLYEVAYVDTSDPTITSQHVPQIVDLCIYVPIGWKAIMFGPEANPLVMFTQGQLETELKVRSK